MPGGVLGVVSFGVPETTTSEELDWALRYREWPECIPLMDTGERGRRSEAFNRLRLHAR